MSKSDVELAPEHEAWKQIAFNAALVLLATTLGPIAFVKGTYS